MDTIYQIGYFFQSLTTKITILTLIFSFFHKKQFAFTFLSIIFNTRVKSQACQLFREAGN